MVIFSHQSMTTLREVWVCFITFSLEFYGQMLILELYQSLLLPVAAVCGTLVEDRMINLIRLYLQVSGDLSGFIGDL